MALKVVFKPADEFMANTVRDLLEQSGVPALIHSYQIPAYDGLARVMRPDWGEVLVEEANLVRARELIDGFLAAEPGSDNVTEASD